MKHKFASKSALFLMELLIAILVFSFTTAICMRIFVHAKLTADYAGNLSIAVTTAQNAAECYKASGGNLTKTAEFLGVETIDSTKLECLLDNEMKLELVAEPGGGIYNTCLIVVYLFNGNEIYRIDVGAINDTGVK